MADIPLKTPTWGDLIACGMYDYSLRAAEIDPPVGNRGTQRDMKAVSWSCTITSFAADRPLVRALRDDPVEADRDARLRFMALFGKHAKPSDAKLPPVMENPRHSQPKKAAAKMDLDAEAASLI
jgi:hypothetical protein